MTLLGRYTSPNVNGWADPWICAGYQNTGQETRRHVKERVQEQGDHSTFENVQH